MRFSVCIDSVFRGKDPVEALGKVRAAGFDAYEFWGWQNKDLPALALKAASLSLDCAALCTRSFSLTEPSRREEYLAGLAESVKAAKSVHCKTLISQGGNDMGTVRAFQHRSIVAGLKAAVPLLEESGITLLLEPLNTRIDHPGTFLEYSTEGFEILDEVGSPWVKLLFDIYHQQITEGDIIRRIGTGIGHIGHFHSAGTPGRHELSTGELNYQKVFEAIDSLGYTGFIGLEYFPLGDAEEGLRQMREYIEVN